MSSDIESNKVELESVGTVKGKHNENYSGFITYSNTISFPNKWLKNRGYVITKLAKLEK